MNWRTCEHCGTINPADFGFCTYCGKALPENTAETEPKREEPPKEEIRIEPTVVSVPVTAPEASSVSIENQFAETVEPAKEIAPLQIPKSGFRMKWIWISAAVLTAILTAGLLLWKKPWITSASEVPKEFLFRISGSQPAVSKWMPLLVDGYLRRQLKCEEVQIRNAAQGNQIITGWKTDSASGTKKEVHVLLQAAGTVAGFRALEVHKTDLVVSAGRVRPEYCRNKSFFQALQQPSNRMVLGRDAWVFVVNESNPLRELSREQAMQLLGGEITQWEMLGVKDGGKVRLILPDTASSAWYIIGNELLPSTGRRISAIAERNVNHDSLVSAVLADKDAIALISHSASGKTVPLALQGQNGSVQPSVFTVSSGDYPLSYEVNLYSGADSLTLAARQFLEYCQTNAGDSAIAAGFVPELPFAVSKGMKPGGVDSLPRKTMERVMKVVNRGEKVNLPVYFDATGIVLEPAQIAKIRRIARFLGTEPCVGKTVFLLGYSPTEAGYGKQSQEASLARAKEVAKYLAEFGIHAETIGAGACSQGGWPGISEWQHEARVEIWLKPEEQNPGH
ncbi:MAG: substrate-binding domain-containing protein [Bacteroidia bacterium]|nr:substrate-binding domain-containing protein [Bacteroidia bacterium]